MAKCQREITPSCAAHKFGWQEVFHELDGIRHGFEVVVEHRSELVSLNKNAEKIDALRLCGKQLKIQQVKSLN